MEVFVDERVGEEVYKRLSPSVQVRFERPPRDDKGVVYITLSSASFFKKCPGTKRYLCCLYRVFNVFEGCPFDCSYCVLQGYLNHLATYVYHDFERGFREVEDFVSLRRDRLIRVGTGELGDSLAVEHIYRTAGEFISFFSRFDNVLFEFKSKSLNLSLLKGYDHGGRIVVSTSLVPDDLSEREEKGVPPPGERIKLLKELQGEGYLIGLHFDPMVWYKGWKEGYRRLLEKVRILDPKRVIWISMGGFRFPKVVKEAIEKRHGNSLILLGEILPCGEDGKYRYFKPVRMEMYSFLYKLLKEWDDDLFIYFCMERRDVWEDVMGFSPRNNAHLSRMFQERAYDVGVFR